MLTLAVDTSAAATSLAILRDDEVLESHHEEHDFPSGDAAFLVLARLLAARELSPRDFDVFAACVGPGSFTGLRVGLGMAKTFAFALRRPIIGIDSVEIAALRAIAAHDIAEGATFRAVVPGMRSVVFSGRFRNRGGRPRRRGELAYHDSLDDLGRDLEPDETISAPAALASRLPGAIPVSDGEPPGVVVGREAAARVRAGEIPAFDAVQPRYLKPFSIGKKASTLRDSR